MLLPRASLGAASYAHSKPGAPGLQSAQHTSHGYIRSPCSTHAAATEVAPSSADDLLRAAAAAAARVRQNHQQTSSSSKSSSSTARRQLQQQQRAADGNGMPSLEGLGTRRHSNWGQQQQQQQQPFQPQQQQQQRQQGQPSRQQPPQQQQNRQQQQHRQHSEPQLKQQPERQQPDAQQKQQKQQKKQPTCKRGSDVRYFLGANQDWSLQTGLAVTWLGTSSGTPTRDRNISCTLVRMPEAIHMVDCGEGSHRQMRKTGIQLGQVDTIYITHLHGDHCFGIGSMLVSMCIARKTVLQQQQQPQQQQEYARGEGPAALRLVGPPRLGEMVSALLSGAGVGKRLDLPVYVTEFVEEDEEGHGWQPLPGCAPSQAFLRRLPPTDVLPPADWPAGLPSRLAGTGLDWQPQQQRVYRHMNTFKAKPGLLWKLESQHATVTAAQLQHRVPCWGYVFDEKLSADQQQQQQQQQGRAAGKQGANRASSSKATTQQEQQQYGRRVLVLGDTVDSTAIAPVAVGADIVSHEATFAAGMEGKAAQAQHSTAWMAGQFAAVIQAKSLVLTHFSARYEGSADPTTKPAMAGRGGGGGGRGQYRARAWEVAQEAADEEAAAERAVMALQREAAEFYEQGQILLAMDLFTAHVPHQDGAQDQGNSSSSSCDSVSEEDAE